MAVNHEQYIKNALSKYKFPHLAKPDIQRVFNVYQDLKPKLESFVFNDGVCKDLLNLEGTIPVTYKGAVYNIPVILYVLDTHPYNPPIVYVKPTKTMRIKPGHHVDTNGKIELPYLRDWQHPNADLLGLIHILVMTFGDSPPVYAVTTPPPRPPYPTQTNRLPYPQEQRRDSYSSTQVTPYPQAGGYIQMPSPSTTSVQQPAPPYPQAYPQPYSTPYPTAATGNPPYPTAAAKPPYPTGGYPNQSQHNFPATTYSQTTPYPNYSTQSAYNTHSATAFGGYPYPTVTTQASSGALPLSGNATVTQEHLRASLLSAVEDKMRRRLKETFDQAQAEMDVLYKTQRDLQAGRDTLQRMVKDLNAEKTDVESKIESLAKKDRELKSALSRMQHQDKVPIDEAVVTVAPLYKQILISFAEEQAVEDAIYYLGEGLRRDVIDLDIFLKQVRELSRRQFMLRSLIQKCREKAGLPGLC